MRIYLLRHAAAHERNLEKFPDDDRPLTKEGRADFVRTAKHIPAVMKPPAAILSSPLKRAKETADILAGAFKSRPRVRVEKAFTAGKSITNQIKIIKGLKRRTSSAVIVGHEPDLSELAASLTAIPQAGIDFKKGALCRIDLPEDGDGVIKWFMPPKVLQRLKKTLR